MSEFSSAVYRFDDFLNEPPEYEGEYRVREYRHEAYLKWKLVFDEVQPLTAECGAKQAKIDELMWEYCPDEMTPEQIAEYEKHQKVVSNDNGES